MKRIVVVVSGGPAPGINAVIGAVAIEGINRGIEVFGINGGFRGLVEHSEAAFSPLHIDAVSRIYNTGGSVLGTARYNPFCTEASTQQLLDLFRKLSIDGLVVIGGEGSATLSQKIHLHLPELRIAHVPKTIDNDIPLPSHQNTFGFETARSVGKEIVDTLVVDAKTCNRWYLVETMGRQAGFLTLGIQLSSGACLSLIPEEFGERLFTPSEIVEGIVRSMLLRLRGGKNYGVILVAEGILDRLEPGSSPALRDSLRDELGRFTYSSVELGEVLLPSLRERLDREWSEPISITHKNLGYELRCARPVGSDIEYARALGFGAVECLASRQGAFMITKAMQMLSFLPLADFVRDGRVPGRTVDLASDYYRIARSYMVRERLF